jgi:predicted nuclease with TOPRIM domain
MDKQGNLELNEMSNNDILLVVKELQLKHEAIKESLTSKSDEKDSILMEIKNLQAKVGGIEHQLSKEWNEMLLIEKRFNKANQMLVTRLKKTI